MFEHVCTYSNMASDNNNDKQIKVHRSQQAISRMVIKGILQRQGLFRKLCSRMLVKNISAWVCNPFETMIGAGVKQLNFCMGFQPIRR